MRNVPLAKFKPPVIARCLGNLTRSRKQIPLNVRKKKADVVAVAAGKSESPPALRAHFADSCPKAQIAPRFPRGALRAIWNGRETLGNRRDDLSSTILCSRLINAPIARTGASAGMQVLPRGLLALKKSEILLLSRVDERCARSTSAVCNISSQINLELR